MSILLDRAKRQGRVGTAHYGYVLEIGRVVMNDSSSGCTVKDIQEFYLGAKEAGARAKALEKEENVR